ncbi:MAG: hypothetical protein JSS86_15315, partial [Cyanobacteria bacterium SZAS LIN-2]|nr:hypothetical protein [Cyanobacteria bacterium SZAS LIN-2]
MSVGATAKSIRLACASVLLASTAADAFPGLWPKAKDEGKAKEEKPAPRQILNEPAIKPLPKPVPKPVPPPANIEVPASIPRVAVPIEFVPPSSAEGAVRQDPMAIYRSAGVSVAEERKIRQLAQEFEGMQRVRLKLMANLLGELREFEFHEDPDPKAVLEKQAEINKLAALMANERVKLILAIRDAMTFEEKQRLVE